MTPDQRIVTEGEVSERGISDADVYVVMVAASMFGIGFGLWAQSVGAGLASGVLFFAVIGESVAWRKG